MADPDDSEFKVDVDGIPAVAIIEIEPVHPVKKTLKCWCGEPMNHTGIVLTSIPSQYPHKCPRGHMTVAPHPTASYPHISF